MELPPYQSVSPANFFILLKCLNYFFKNTELKLLNTFLVAYQLQKVVRVSLSNPEHFHVARLRQAQADTLPDC
jgi:hypothetical protein